MWSRRLTAETAKAFLFNLMLTYTVIQHEFRKEHKLSCTEYVLCDMIFYLSSIKSAVSGWCYLSKENMALEIGLSKPGLLLMIERLIIAGFLEKNEQTKYLKTTFLWQRVYISGKESLPAVNGKESLPENDLFGKESLPISGKESLPYNNTNNNKKKDNKSIFLRKEDFYKEIIAFKNHNPCKYPFGLFDKFFTYWTEENKSKSKMRFEDQKFFDIGKRLATFWTNTSDQERETLQKLHLKNLNNTATNGHSELKEQRAQISASLQN